MFTTVPFWAVVAGLIVMILATLALLNTINGMD
jgi:hypothetical protein